MVKRLLYCFIIILVVLLGFPRVSFAQQNGGNPKQLLGTVKKLDSKIYSENGKLKTTTYQVTLDSSHKIILADYDQNSFNNLSINDGDQVMVIPQPGLHSTASYYIVDKYRLPALLWAVIIFAIAALLIIGKKGFGSLLGLLVSLTIVLFGIVPFVLRGGDPLIVTAIGACFIMLITTYLAHGISRKTTVALVSTAISIFITFLLANIAMYFLQINGYGGEDAYNLYLATNSIVNAKGLFLSGIIIATLGALNDVTVTQSAMIFQLKKVKPEMTLGDLITHGFSVGREHASSMVNTIILVYAGSSLGVFFFFIINTKSQGYLALLNNEFIVEEIVKTLAGTLGILLAVPIVTLLAAWVVDRNLFKKKSSRA